MVMTFESIILPYSLPFLPKKVQAIWESECSHNVYKVIFCLRKFEKHW